MVNESQVRTFIISDKTCELQSCVRTCHFKRTAFIRCRGRRHVSVILLFNVHNNVSKFDRVTNRITKMTKRKREPSRVLVKLFMNSQKKIKNRKKLEAFVKSHKAYCMVCTITLTCARERENGARGLRKTKDSVCIKHRTTILLVMSI